MTALANAVDPCGGFLPPARGGRSLPSLFKALGNMRPEFKKRFIFWDDFRPVDYASDDTIPVHVFLSIFIGKPTEITAIALPFVRATCALFMGVSGLGLTALCIGG